MKFEADFHNFGQSVQKIGRGSETYFQKPRPVYWEWLFFGRNSPLSSFFVDRSVLEIPPREVLFNLEVELGSDFCGISKQVIADPAHGKMNTHLYSLGVLLGYAYAFGIRDLHRNNVVKTSTHLQVIDAEVVLSRLLLPHETLLLPYKDVGPDLCGAASIIDLTLELSVDELTAVLNGYCAVFRCIQRNLSQIGDVLESRIAEMRGIPVRHILRDTIHYRSFKSKNPEIPIFEAETQQLKRGDIPYFFKFVGQNEVFAYADALGGYSQVQLPQEFIKGATREAVSANQLLERARIESIAPTGLLYLMKRLSGSHRKFSFVASNVSGQCVDSQIVISYFGKQYRSS